MIRLVLVSLLLLSACEGPVGPAGPQGPTGRPAIDTADWLLQEELNRSLYSGTGIRMDHWAINPKTFRNVYLMLQNDDAQLFFPLASFLENPATGLFDVLPTWGIGDGFFFVYDPDRVLLEMLLELDQDAYLVVHLCCFPESVVD